MIHRPNFHSIWRSKIAFAILVGFLAMVVSGVGILEANDKSTSGSSSKSLRKQTVNSIPLQALNAQAREKIVDILKKPSIYRQLPVTSINADPDYFRFLIRYPEVIVNIWQLMGITNMTTERTGPFTVTTNDGAGTVSQLELVYGTDNLHIFFGEGSYEGPIFKRKLTGKCVLVLKTESKFDEAGKPVATSQLDVFLKIENATAGLIAKTIQPIVGSTADHNFVESLKFVQRLNETTSKNGPGVQRMGKKLKIEPAVRESFNEVIELVFQRAINGSDSSGVNLPQRLGTFFPPSYPAVQGNRPAMGQLPTYSGFTRGYHSKTYTIPATGSQAPNYYNSNLGLRPLPLPEASVYGKPVQAGYQQNQSFDSKVRPASGWYYRN
ncbi:MAG: hypothetical protein OSA89_01030 [Mariniblastus sp.]|nr:hypothetical protein [Mariniblastus sp.]